MTAAVDRVTAPDPRVEDAERRARNARADAEDAAGAEIEARLFPGRNREPTRRLVPCPRCADAAALALHLAVSDRYPEPVPDDARGPLAARLREYADRLEAAGSYRDRPREVALVIGALRDEAARWDGETGRLTR